HRGIGASPAGALRPSNYQRWRRRSHHRFFHTVRIAIEGDSNPALILLSVHGRPPSTHPGGPSMRIAIAMFLFPARRSRKTDESALQRRGATACRHSLVEKG